MEFDIESRVAQDFAPAERSTALEILERLASSDSGQPRVLRCVLFLARGDLSRLAHNIKRAHADWRDVIYWAEYDEQGRPRHDFDRPFAVESDR